MIHTLLLLALAIGIGDGRALVRDGSPGQTVIDPSFTAVYPTTEPMLPCTFDVPGAYASGTTELCGVFDPWTGTTLTVTRSSAATFEPTGWGTVEVAAADELRVDRYGALVEETVDNRPRSPP